ncbi:MAG: ribosomal RNA small subunit methyltransferase A [Verrucomicrobia bacterium]|jgi:16S rRNA (adenine1518-N6/adenine1519-N6)-dimethyltransferase|nr:ribosomal RNA small subunit methyltransferase A [Verrucomicrobiota bacterium]OQC67226.1 MAG: Ribosomal RNA small subunit methyltransferase A [Verrucomicrobia bacterium ADurb.Bin006]MDI9381471.1 16S rRNA (adenine(1518)-N(6)/adenine(1519)-N(6))-dimethyltransferase RsmA [Verrucomicrobiota bacterium]NMD19746.1 ribosomal RNA small subunit methyltransferase A [Verrucomicrobiota bacterium]HOA59887.1 16S rRNA (adenine(1518)-N(6)/adenine(1519)-N(6))-dimethyltransferase RsmA [Verrucomicrobiota bacteri
MTLSEMRQILTARRIRLTKSLGQNFLHDGNQLRRMVGLAGLRPNDQVIEIGPGLGPLTELLLAGAREVLTIEKDARLVRCLDERFAGDRRLRLVHADAVDFLAGHAEDWASWKLVAALPYSAASEILMTLALAPTCPERLVITLQQEVAQRLSVGPGSPDYGILTLIVRHRYAPAASFSIPASCFFPPPKIATTCLALDRRSGPGFSAFERRTFARLVRSAFSQRRKMMFKLLRSGWDEEALRGAFETLDLSQTCRAESLGLERFEALARLLTPSGGDTQRF